MPQCLAVDLMYHLVHDYIGWFSLYIAVFCCSVFTPSLPKTRNSIR